TYRRSCSARLGDTYLIREAAPGYITLLFSPPPRPPSPTLFPYTTLFRSLPAFRLIPPCNAPARYRRPMTVRSPPRTTAAACQSRSEEHTSELQSRGHLVCRLLLEKKKYVTRCCSTANRAERSRGVPWPRA